MTENAQAKPVIEMRDITKIYHIGGEEVRALDHATLTIREGEFVAIIGPSGSGKSTLMNIMGCLDTADSGEYLLDGQQIEHYSEDELARIRNRKIGFVFQSFDLLPKMTAQENVELPLIYQGVSAAERRKRSAEVLRRVGLESRAGHKPTELSGGQQQRVALASLLVLQPEIMVIDEPTSQLDPEGTESVFRIIAALKQSGSTIILIEHKIDLVAEYADEIIVVSEGGILCQGTPKAVFSDPELPEHHVRLPYVTQIAHELMARGVRLDTVPVTESEAVEVFEKALEGGNGNG